MPARGLKTNWDGMRWENTNTLSNVKPEPGGMGKRPGSHTKPKTGVRTRVMSSPDWAEGTVGQRYSARRAPVADARQCTWAQGTSCMPPKIRPSNCPGLGLGLGLGWAGLG